MKRTKAMIGLLAAVLVLGMGVGTAWAYFTDSTTAEGSIPIKVEPTTTITEENSPGTKTFRIRNTGRTSAVYVRARIYAANELGASGTGTNWSGDIGTWFQYGEPLAVGAETEPLVVSFSLKHVYDPVENPEGAREGDETNIVAVYECVPVTYGADGKPLPADWND